MEHFDDGVHADGSKYALWLNGRKISVHDTRKEANLALSEAFNAARQPAAQAPAVVKIEHNPQSGKWNVYSHGQYVAGYSSEQKAITKKRELLGLPALSIDAPPKPKHGVILNPGSGQFHVWFKGSYYGNYIYEDMAKHKFADLTARAKESASR